LCRAWYGDYGGSTLGTIYNAEYGHRSCCDGQFPEDFFQGDFHAARQYVWSVVGTIMVTFCLTLIEARRTYDTLESLMPSSTEKFDFAVTTFGYWDHTCGTGACREAQAMGFCQLMKVVTLHQKKNLIHFFFFLAIIELIWLSLGWNVGVQTKLKAAELSYLRAQEARGLNFKQASACFTTLNANSLIFCLSRILIFLFIHFVAFFCVCFMHFRNL
jgi:hypothetical protein